MDDCATQFDIEKPVKRQLKSQKFCENKGSFDFNSRLQ